MKITVFDRSSVCGEDLSLSELNSLGEVSLYDTVPPAKVADLIGESEIVLCNKTEIGAEVFERCPKLRYIGVMATGYNTIDAKEAHARGITVCNIPGYSTDAVAQQTFAFILQFASNLCAYIDSTRRGDWQKSEMFTYFPYPMTELCGKTLGIFGFGAIGQKVASIGTAFGMRVIYHSRTKKDVPYAFVSKEELFAQSDFLSLHCPLTPETERLVNRETLSLMKKSACLINTSRGGAVDEKVLAEFLNDEKIAGFAADVLTKDPQLPSCPLFGAKNCFLTPHVAWVPFETRQRLIGILIGNLRAFLAGKPQNAV